MDFDLDARRARMSVGDLADFAIGPRESGGGPSGIWRAQLGIHWHRQLRAQATAADPAAEFEIAIEGDIFHRGWTLVFNGRIDQLVQAHGARVLREIKTVTRALPAPATELRADYPSYFAQAAAYVALLRQAAAPSQDRGLQAEVVFVEADTGLAQAVPLLPSDEALFRGQIERVAEFLDLRLRARERLRLLRFRPPFAELRPGQESVLARLEAALRRPPGKVLLEAPTGFGKTGVLLEVALGELRAGRYERVLYLTGKSTGQIQVSRTLAEMTRVPEAEESRLRPLDADEAAANSAQGRENSVAVWLVRPKSEHCVNAVFHCLRESCAYLDGMEERWPQSGLARFYLFENQPHDLATLRAAGVEARICPYEITRASLPFNDVWIGDYNYVFAPANSRLFSDQPGFAPAQTLLLIDEAHNLPSRVADAYSHSLTAEQAQAVRDGLSLVHAPAPLLTAWDEWTGFLERLEPAPALAEADRATVHQLIPELAEQVSAVPVDYATLGPRLSGLLWQMPSLATQLEDLSLPRLEWSPRRGTLALTCLDAAAAIGHRLREFGGVVLASATPGPLEAFAAAVGLDKSEIEPSAEAQPAIATERLGDLTKRETRRLTTQVTSGAGLLRLQETRGVDLAPVTAFTPWREGAYDVAFDLRVDTTFQQRTRHYAATAATVAALAAQPGPLNSPGPVVVFFSSYAYAEAIVGALESSGTTLRAMVQPRLPDLGAQAAWMEESLKTADALFLILGSSFAESIDLLGGRVDRAMVVGPALPEVNAVQQARLAALASLGRAAAFRRVYQIPGMQKVNQALGRLVRAPGQRAKVLLHCRRFAAADYTALLAADYQSGPRLGTDDEFAAWAGAPAR
jgi:DNA excision repair protein ERCC-2